MMTKDDMLKVYEFIDSSDLDIAPSAKVDVLNLIIDSYNQMSDEERNEFPEDFPDDIRLLNFRTNISSGMQDENVEGLKKMAEEDLHPVFYRNALPYYRAQYAFLYSFVCLNIADKSSYDEEQEELWTFRGLKSIETALDIISRADELDSLAKVIELKANLLKHKSINEGINFVQLMLGFSDDEKYLETLSPLWKELNELRFNEFFDTEDIRFLDELPISDELKDKINDEIPEYHAKQFCCLVPSYDRDTVLIVNDILDITKDELQEAAKDAQYIFEIDRIPADVRFADGKPQSGILYDLDENEFDLYHPAKQLD